MPLGTPILHPVTEIVESLLTHATASSTHPRLPTHEPLVVDLSAVSDDEPTIVLDTRCPSRPAAYPSQPVDEDDIEIVSAAIIAPPPSAINVDDSFTYPALADRDPHPPSIDDDIIDVEAHIGDTGTSRHDLVPVSCEAGRDGVQKEAPVVLSEGDEDDEEDEVVECFTTARRPRVRDVCDACLKTLQRDSGGVNRRLCLSRCKHTLCDSCILATVYRYDDGGKFNLLPTCVVDRCRAPLSAEEMDTALAGPEVDKLVEGELEAFHAWREGILGDDETGSGTEFPGFSVEFTAVAGKGGVLDGVRCLMNDDVRTACEPLWMWNPDAVAQSAAWICVACREMEGANVNEGSRVRPGVSRANGKKDNDSDDIIDVVDDVEPMFPSEFHDLPPSPSYPHCAYARAMGVYENVKGLERVWEDGKEAATRRKREEEKAKAKEAEAISTNAKLTQTVLSNGNSAEGKRRSARKRYMTACIVRSHKRRKGSKGTGFAKGTGYAGSSGTEWKGTSEELLEETQKLDAEATYWLIRIRCFLLRPSDAQLTSWPVFMRALLRECQLVAHLAKILINESIMDVLGRIPVFYAALRVVHALTELPSLRVLVTELSDGENGRTLAELVESLSRQAAVLATGAGPEGLQESARFLIKQIRKCIRGINRHNLLQVARNRNSTSCTIALDDADDAGLPTAKDVKIGHGSSHDNGVEVSSKGTESLVSFEADKVTYIENMREHQFMAVPGLASTSVFYQEAMQSDSQNAIQGKRQRRIATEVASLCSSLPLSWSSTILLRVDEDRYDLLRACIFGPEDTPYDSGAFLFDIYLPAGYPYVPPKFRLLTTGSGRVRFNPNLYNNGKVCLSLLGTWSGPSWTSASTILQVLVSIQSLILVPDPYFNEPGFERAVGTDAGKRSSAQYNRRVQLDCALHAIQYNIRHPMAELEAGILAHFRLKRRYITHMLCQWFSGAAGAKQGTSSENDGGASAAVGGGTMLSADPTGLGGLNVAVPGLAVSTFGPGRNYRAPEMTVSNLEKILADLEAIGHQRRPCTSV